jgi:hypothetical protein
VLNEFLRTAGKIRMRGTKPLMKWIWKRPTHTCVSRLRGKFNADEECKTNSRHVLVAREKWKCCEFKTFVSVTQAMTAGVTDTNVVSSDSRPAIRARTVQHKPLLSTLLHVSNENNQTIDVRGYSHDKFMSSSAIWQPSSYFTEDTLNLRYRVQPVNAM